MDSQSKAEEKMIKYQLHFRYTHTDSAGATQYTNRTAYIACGSLARAIQILKDTYPTAYNIYENIWARESMQ